MLLRILRVALLLAGGLGPGCVTWRDRDRPPGWVGPEDFVRDYGNFVQTDRLKNALLQRRNAIPALALAAGSVLAATDSDVSLQARLSRHPVLGPTDPATRSHHSDLGQYALIAAPFVLPLLVAPEGDGVRRTGYVVTAAEASLYTLGFTTATKRLVGRGRPAGRGGGSSFVSGHTSAAFMGATLLHREYGWKVGVPAYLAAGTVGLYRVESDHHYPGDVLAGAALGALIANLVYDKNLGEKGLYRRSPRWAVAPVVGRDRIGLSLSVGW